MARSVFLNVVGQLVPLAVALLTIPVTLRLMGADRFGILTLAWLVLGYSTLFDLGVTRGMVKYVTEAIGKRERELVSRLTWTALALNTGLGLLAAAALATAARVATEQLVMVPSPISDEARSSVLIIALTVPVLLLTGTFRGLLEAQQRFDLVNLVSIPASALTYLLPAIGVTENLSLPDVLLLLLLSRIAAGAAYALLARRTLGLSLNDRTTEYALAKKLLRYGGWVTISAFVPTLFAYADRLLITGIVSVAALTYYAIPYEVTARIWIVPIALSSALFPRFNARLIGSGDASRLYALSLKFLMLTVCPIVMLLIIFGYDFMSLWLGRAVATSAAPVLRILAVGVLVNSLAFVPFNYLQAIGRPDVPGKIHAMEVLPFLVVTALAVTWLGPLGAAISFTARLAAEAMLLFVSAGRLHPGVSVLPLVPGLAPYVAGLGIMTCVVLAAVMLPLGVFPRLAAAIAGTLLSIGFTATFLLGEGDRHLIGHLARDLLARSVRGRVRRR